MIRTKVFIHGNSDSMWDKGFELHLTGEALSMFSHACDEFELELEVDELTGITKVISFDGRMVT